MRLSISNLAWPADAFDDAMPLVLQGGASGIEVAPTRLAPWEALEPKVLSTYRDHLASYGLVPSSLQAIFFAVPEAQLLGDGDRFEVMISHLRRLGAAAEVLGVQTAVFGAPQNRNRRDLDTSTALQLAAERCRQLAYVAADVGLVLAIEPVPTFYKSDFLTTWEEVLTLVKWVDHPAVRLHLDTGCVHLGGGDVAVAIQEGGEWLRHFHAAQPNLGDFSNPLAEHESASTALHNVAYEGWVAIEMLAQPDWRSALTRALMVARNAYSC